MGEKRWVQRVWDRVVAELRTGHLMLSQLCNSVSDKENCRRQDVASVVATMRGLGMVTSSSEKPKPAVQVAAPKKAPSLTSCCDEAKRLAENCEIEEIERRFGDAEARAALTWLWNISQTMPLTEALFALAREGRFVEVDQKASDAVAQLLRGWCFVKSDEWLNRRRKRGRGFDARQARTVVCALDQLHPSLKKGEAGQHAEDWLCELADDDDEDDELLAIDETALKPLTCALEQDIEATRQRRAEAGLRKVLRKHGLIKEKQASSRPDVDGTVDEEQAELLRDVASRDIPDIHDTPMLPVGRTAAQYAARARRRRTGGKKRSFASGRAAAASSRRKINPPSDKRQLYDVPLMAPLKPVDVAASTETAVTISSIEPSDADFLTAVTQGVPWQCVVRNIDNAHFDVAWEQQQAAKRPKLLSLKSNFSETGARELPAPAVTRLDAPYDDNVDDDDDDYHGGTPLDPVAMLESHDAVLADMKDRIDKLVHDARTTNDHHHHAPSASSPRRTAPTRAASS